MPDRVGPGAIGSGYVFTHRETGLKFITVAMLRGADELRFRFIVPVAGPELAIERVDLAKLWPPDAFRDVDLDGLRAALAALPCCGANADGSGSYYVLEDNLGEGHDEHLAGGIPKHVVDRRREELRLPPPARRRAEHDQISVPLRGRVDDRAANRPRPYG